MPSLLTGPVEPSGQPSADAPHANSFPPPTSAPAPADKSLQSHGLGYDYPDATQLPEMTGRHDQRAATNENHLGLDDVSSDLSWLGPLINDGSVCGSVSPSAGRPPAPAPDTVNNSPKISTQTHHQPTNNNSSSRLQPTADVTPLPNNHTPVPIQPRKPSPGLAARLKALGLGAGKKSSPPSAWKERDIGRLPEEQLRQLDEYHQQRSRQLAIERRGRPWKGLVRIPSKASLKSTKSNKDALTPEDVVPRDNNIPQIKILDSPGADDHSDLLADFEAAEPPAMDTNKYRLPDHTNGNGTKVTLDTRSQHLGRDMRPPPSPEETPPPVPEKDYPPAPSQSFNPEDYFNPLGLQRPGSIYTISRASFAHQLAQLTSLQLPDAESLAGKVAAIPTAQAAVKALIGAAEQIRSWIYKASEVISGLDSDDDVEWSAAGGREGLEEVEDATARFEQLINVYVTAIEELQNRTDIALVSADDLTRAVTQMEAITEEWTSIRATLRSVRGQVEIAMEWEELWNVVLGEIQTELEELSRLVFEMEERRHKSAMVSASGDAVDINDLATIAEETLPATIRTKAANKRFSATGSPTSPTSPGGPSVSHDDSSLLALFARMQPLRASLDFLPMRLSVFEARAERSFPSACDELEMRRESLDASYRKLEKDAEVLRKELGEDRWVLVFRGAARQAQKMMESVERSVARLRDAVEARMHLTNQPALLKKIESFEAKKTHYGPAIDRVLFIIDRGVKDRLTVNGEILRLHAEMQAKWADLKNQIKEMDFMLEGLHADKRGNRLRDSISSMLSNDLASTVGSGFETPQSSPPSSVIMSGLGIDTRTPGKSGTATRARRSSSSVSGHQLQPGRRSVSAANTPSIPRKPVSRLSTSSGLSTPRREGSATPTTNRLAASIPRPASTMAHRPKWNAYANPAKVDTGHNFKPLTLTTPSPYAKTTPNPVRSHSSLAAPIGSKLPTMRSPFRASPSSPIQDATPSKPAAKMSFRDRLAAPGPYSQHTNSKFRPEGSSARRSTLQPPQANTPGPYQRPASSLATTNRRTSLLPQPRVKREESVPGRESPMPSNFGSRLGLRRGNSTSSNDRKDSDKDNKPRWRH